MTTILVTGATGDTGRPTVAELLKKKGLAVRALVHREDSRSKATVEQFINANRARFVRAA
jgi:uncharacterized protein YbjT (DUF2867 family)